MAARIEKTVGDAWEPGSAVGDVDVVEHGGADPGRIIRSAGSGSWSTRCSPSSTTMFDAMYAAGGRRSRAAGGVVEGDGVDGDVLDPLGAGVLRTAQLRPVVQVVPGHAHRPAGVRRDRRSPRTASACWSTRSRTSSSPPSCARPSCAATCRREHFSVDGTLLEAWASHKSFKPKDGPPSEPPAGRNAEVAVPRREALERHPRLDDRPGSHGCIARATTPRRRCATPGTC